MWEYNNWLDHIYILINHVNIILANKIGCQCFTKWKPPSNVKCLLGKVRFKITTNTVVLVHHEEQNWQVQFKQSLNQYEKRKKMFAS